MKQSILLAIGLITTISLNSFAAALANDKCPGTGKPVNPKCTLEHEGKTYAFCSGKCRKDFDKARKNSLYHKIGGKAAIDAAVELFYTKVLARFATSGGLKLTLIVEVAPPGGVTKQRLEETRVALRELGMDEALTVADEDA